MTFHYKCCLINLGSKNTTAFIQNRVEMFQKGGFFVLGYLMIRFIAFIECFLKVLSFE